MARRRKKNWSYSGLSELGETVENLLYRKDMGGGWLVHKIFHHCIERLGEEFMKHMEPVSINNGVMYCNVDNPIWVHQYTMRKKQILSMVNQKPTPLQLVDIRFKVGRITKSEYIFEEDPEVSFKKELQQQQLDHKDKEFINEQLAECHPDLREDMCHFLETALKMQKLRGADRHGCGEE